MTKKPAEKVTKWINEQIVLINWFKRFNSLNGERMVINNMQKKNVKKEKVIQQINQQILLVNWFKLFLMNWLKI